MNARIERVRARLPELEAAALLVTDVVNVRYLSGFESSNAALLIAAEPVYLLTDGRYAEAARAVRDVELVQVERNLETELADRLPRLVSGPVAFEAHRLTVARYRKIEKSGVELLPSQGVVEGLRAVKDGDELDVLRRSAGVLDQLFEAFAEQPVVGSSEADLAWRVEQLAHELGADGVSFAPIVASGPNAAMPHHHPGPRTVGRDEVVLLDAGCLVGGYCSDCTRTFATGELPGELVRAYEVCLETQLAALAAVTAGASCPELDALARRRLTEAGYEVFHSLGHAVGLEIHEDPRLSKDSEASLEAANAVTVEPGVYLAGLGGIRIEDLAVVTEEGPEVLTSFTKELVTLG